MLGMGVSSDACDGVHYHLGLFARIALIVDTECIIGLCDTGTYHRLTGQRVGSAIGNPPVWACPVGR
jgi:hypothetical protein